MENKSTRLSKAARMFNVGISTIMDFLAKKGIEIDSSPNTKIDAETFELLAEEYSSDLSIKKKSEELSRKNLQEVHESISIENVNTKTETKSSEEVFIKDVSGTSTEKELPADSRDEKDTAKKDEETVKKPSIKKEEKAEEK